MSFSLITLNVRGLRLNVKRKALFLFAKQQKSDFCFFQEVHSTPNDVSFWKAQWGNDIWFAHGSEHSAGVAILKSKFSGDILYSDVDTLGHYIILVAKCDLLTMILVNFYGYNSKSENDDLFDTLEIRLTHCLSKFPNSLILIGGDFNITLDNSFDRWPPRAPSSSNLRLKAFMQKFGIKDIWREKFPDLKSFTWNNKACTSMSRIDYWLASCSFQKENILINILPVPLTDHRAVSINVGLQSFSNIHYNSYWKLNNSTLDNEYVKVSVRRMIEHYWNLAQLSNEYCNNWELLKFEIGKFLRNYGSVLAKARKHEEENIISKITAFTQRSPPIFSDTEKMELLTLQNHLDDIYKRRAEGAFIRSRQRWLEKGEQNSAYFFQLENSHSKHTISHLNINGILTHEPRSIAAYCSSFYGSLYESRFNKNDTSDFLDSLINTKSISEDEKELCDNSICIEEVLQAIKELK